MSAADTQPVALGLFGRKGNQDGVILRGAPLVTRMKELIGENFETGMHFVKVEIDFVEALLTNSTKFNGDPTKRVIS